MTGALISLTGATASSQAAVGAHRYGTMRRSLLCSLAIALSCPGVAVGGFLAGRAGGPDLAAAARAGALAGARAGAHVGSTKGRLAGYRAGYAAGYHHAYASAYALAYREALNR